ncbi:MAG: STM4013/SEN3800 family hydrolase [Methylococcales bacterium]|jgi:hypothetical protein|nr:STM4013/SEN3800 family hydrolase [Methylococcales bacterium]MBT7444188.1 STM4013/SEN3800 family hydrolase [Methylococcales bacterium]
MNTIVGSHDIVFITLDTLRFDVATSAMKKGLLPVLQSFFNQWQRRHSPGSFTYAAHHAFFAGFLPTPMDEPLAPRLMALDFEGSRSVDDNTKQFQAPTIIAGLEQEGYATVCIGGVGFFNQLNPLGCVLPDLFQHRFWSDNMGVTCPDSTKHQVNKALNCLRTIQETQRLFLFMNISALHQPNYFYRENNAASKKAGDDVVSQSAALSYVDAQLQPLFEAFKHRSNTLFIMCSDHGTCYGEQGYSGHRLAHEQVWTVPYAEFIQEKHLCE